MIKILEVETMVGFQNMLRYYDFRYSQEEIINISEALYARMLGLDEE